jgi:hypothetical protein
MAFPTVADPVVLHASLIKDSSIGDNTNTYDRKFKTAPEKIEWNEAVSSPTLK